ncbi:MAG: hypothetical protein ACP5H8_03820 [Candidatus Micrarchaeia archaeon]
MSDEGVFKEEEAKGKKKGEEFKEKETMGELKKKQAYTAHGRKFSNKEIFAMMSGFKKKWVKGFLGVLKKLLGG